MTATATITMGRRAEMSPKTKARLIGVLFLITMVGGGFAQGFIGGKLISGDVSATATNILAHEPLYRLAFAILSTLSRWPARSR